MADWSQFEVLLAGATPGAHEADSFGQFLAVNFAVAPVPPNPVELLGVLPTAPGPIANDALVQFDVRSLTAMVRVVVSFRFEGFGFREVAFDGDPTAGASGYEELYSPSSTVETITDGLYFRYRFKIVRNPAWPSSPELDVVAYNEDGQEFI